MTLRPTYLALLHHRRHLAQADRVQRLPQFRVSVSRRSITCTWAKTPGDTLTTHTHTLVSQTRPRTHLP
jgi:hypothetical protein